MTSFEDTDRGYFKGIYKINRGLLTKAMYSNITHLQLSTERTMTDIPTQHNRSNVTLSICEIITLDYADFTQFEVVNFLFVVIYILTALIALLGNILVIITVWLNAKMHSKTNYYIVNLAVSDFIVALFVLPLKVVELSCPCSWQVYSNEILCPAMRFLQPIFVFTSILTLMAISIER